MHEAYWEQYTKRITYLIGLDGRIENIIEGRGASNHRVCTKPCRLSSIQLIKKYNNGV
ncbi:MAG: hypothetical protein ACREA5_05235 [Nitrosotalea sp.]